MSVNLTVNLPTYDGPFEAGIAVGVDPSLPEDKKLSCHAPRDGSDDAARDTAIALSLRATYTRFIDGKRLKPEVVDLYMYGAIAVLYCGLTSPTDGDNVIRDLSVECRDPNGADDLLGARMDESKLITALTVIVGTKATFWMTNHHTGGKSDALTSYIGKVAAVKFPENVRTDKDFITACHAVGHWASTRIVLAKAGIEGIRQCNPIYRPKGNLALSDDAKLRFKAMPAGTHRLAVAFEAAKRLARSKALIVCPGVEEMASLTGLREQVMEKPAQFHVGAAYLTGQARVDYDDTANEHVLGRLGTYVNTVLSGSTLAKSPHFEVARVKSYPDFSEDFQSTLNQLKMMEVKAQRDTLSYITQATDLLSTSRIRSLCSSFGVAATETQLSLASDAKAIEDVPSSSSEEEDVSPVRQAPDATRKSKRTQAAAGGKAKKLKK